LGAKRRETRGETVVTLQGTNVQDGRRFRLFPAEGEE